MSPSSTPIKVTWRDCFTSNSTWKEASEPPDDPVIVSSVGWELKDYLDGYLVLADAWFERDGDLYYGSLTHIPSGMVISRESLGWTRV